MQVLETVIYDGLKQYKATELYIKYCREKEDIMLEYQSNLWKEIKTINNQKNFEKYKV